MDWRLGTMGFSYADWAGTLYPPGMKPGDYLGHYARYFDAVELDTTFHAVPPAERFRRWAEATPAGFRFSVKTPRAVTHDVPPDRAVPAMLEFLDAARGLGEKLGVVLIQYPPGFEADQFERVDAFLSELPADVRYAVELRNRTWGSRRTLDMLRRHRCCLVAAEYLTRPGRVHATTDFLYVRWIGEHGRFPRQDREQIDVGESLAWWAAQLANVGPELTAAWGFFNNDFAGYSVATCNRFKGMLGLPVVEPPAIPGGLFG
jgi:uncharacterized protein YecE (DUF72 family)